jgi:hypothetical protein
MVERRCRWLSRRLFAGLAVAGAAVWLGASITSLPVARAATSCAWQQVAAAPTPAAYANGFEGVLARSATNVWAVGWAGAQATVQHFDGITWSNVAIPTVAGASQSRLLGIDAASDNDIWAVGYAITDTYHTLTMHWNGVAWSIVPSPDQRFPGQNVINALNAVAVVSATDVWAVGGDIRNFNAQASEAVLMHWNGTQWTLSTPPDESFATADASRYGVAAISSSDVWALGDIGDLRWNGAQWVYAGAATQATVGVSAVDAANVWAVGNTQGYSGEGGTVPGVPFATRWNGASWSAAQLLPYSDGAKGFGQTAVRAVDARTAGDVWAVGLTGKGTYTAHYDGTGWTLLPSPDGNDDYADSFTSNALYGVSAVSDGDVWSVGSYTTGTGEERLLILHYACGVNPPPPSATLATLSSAVASIVGGRSTTGTVTLTAAAPTGGAAVTLRSSSGNVTLPASVNVSAGATSASFLIATTKVRASSTVTLTASYAGRQRSTTLVITRR